MLFNSTTFILFFIVISIIYYGISNWAAKKHTLLVSSYLFYAAWNPPFILLLFISTLVDWHLANKINTCSSQKQRKIWLILSLVFNLGLLSVFKYNVFLLDNFSQFLTLLGIDISFADPGIILPMGISFYTFQTLSYTIDVYKRKIPVEKSFLDYALFVSFFPQLVAGPIVRAKYFLPQLKTTKIFSLDNYSLGMSLFIIGLFSKTVLADGFFAPIVDQVFSSELKPDLLSSWLSGWFFYGQIFCDFSGYSLCAIGVALCLGFNLPLNFQSPFAAIGFSDFWRRWHISLSSWLRDYLYIPLGGNRYGNLFTLRNLFITMLLGGLWHGAAWTFVIWGVLHGLYLIFERVLKGFAFAKKLAKIKLIQPILMLLTMLFVMLAFIVFRAEDFNQVITLYSGLLNIGETNPVLTWNIWTQIITMVFIGLTVVQWIYKNDTLPNVLSRMPIIPKSLLLSFCLLIIFTSSGNSDAFIYFQF